MKSAALIFSILLALPPAALAQGSSSGETGSDEAPQGSEAPVVPAADPSPAPIEPAAPSPPAPTTAAPRRSATLAIEEGYLPRPQDEAPGSLLGGMLALIPGLLVHGVGHYYVGEERTALKLLIAEILGVAMIVSGTLLANTTSDSGQLGLARRTLLHAGVLLFAGSWLADILGAFKGGTSFEPDSTHVDGTRFGLAYRYVGDPRSPLHHHLVLGLDARAGRFVIRPQIDLEANLDTRAYQLDVMYQLIRGQNAHNSLGLGVEARRLETPYFGLAARSVEGSVRSKLDLGQFIRSLRNFYVVNQIGIGVEQYQIASSTDRTPAILGETDFYSNYFVISSGGAVNTGRNTHVSLMFVQDPTLDVAPASRDSGVLELGLTHRYQNDLDIEFNLTGGDGWAVWLGLGYGL